MDSKKMGNGQDMVYYLRATELLIQVNGLNILDMALESTRILKASVSVGNGLMMSP